MSAFDPWVESDEAPWEKVNEAFDILGQAFVFAERPEGHIGLTVGYGGGNSPFTDTAVADGTVAGLTDDTTNYIVAHRTTNAVTSSTATTNWNNTGTYGRVARAVFASGVLTWHDARDLIGGVFDHSGTPGAVDAEDVAITDVGGYFTGTDVEAALQEIGAALAAASGTALPAQHYTVELANTTDSDPGAGLLKFNHATPTSATFLYIDDATADGVDLSTYFGSLGATGFIKLFSAADATEWAIFRWSAVTDGTGYFKFAVVLQASRGTFEDADALLVLFDSDAAGAATSTELRGLTFTSDTGSTADSDPGAGLMKWNNATQGSATKLFFDNSTLDSVAATTFFAALGTDALLYMQQADDATRWQLWELDTATADSGYYDFAVTLLAKSSADIEDDKTVLCDFSRKGTAGTGTTGKHGIYIAAGSMRPSATGGCAALAGIASAANQPDIVTLDFDATTQEYAQFGVRMPKSWNEGTVTFAPIWSHAATTTNFGVVWDLQAVAVSDDDAIAVAFGTAQTSTDTGGTTNDVYIGPESSAITVAGTPAAEDMVFFRLSRVTGSGSDTMAIDARLHGITLYITTDAENDA
jgi:hypothetical protein